MTDLRGRVVCLPNCAYLSETTRMLAIHHALRDSGVDAVMATHGGTHEHMLDMAGIEVDRLEPAVSDARSRAFIAQTPGIGSPRQSMWSDAEIRSTAIAERDYFRDVGAVAVATGFQLTTLISSRLAGIPVITSHAGSWVPPVLERGLVPPQSTSLPAGMRVLPRPMRRYLANRGALRFKGYTHGFNRVAEELGVERVPSFPALLCGDLTLVTEAPELLGITSQELAAWQARGPGLRPSTTMRFVGPLFARLPMAIPDHVQAFLAAPGDVVYVAMTSTPPDVVADVVREVRKAGVRVLVVTTVHDVDRSDDPDVLAVAFLPSHDVMPRVALAVVTGGQGSVQTALAAGTPFIGLPLQPEQEWNVAVAEKAGAARMIGLRDLTRQLAVSVTQMMHDPGARASAQRVADIYASYDGPVLSAAAIREYLSSPRAGEASRAA